MNKTCHDGGTEYTADSKSAERCSYEFESRSWYQQF